jgi:hypothetical protein
VTLLFIVIGPDRNFPFFSSTTPPTALFALSIAAWRAFVLSVVLSPTKSLDEAKNSLLPVALLVAETEGLAVINPTNAAASMYT